MSLLDECLETQKAAGFPREDRRKIECRECGAPGFNSGWGYWRFECGAEILTDGTPDKDCPKLLTQDERSG
jgi:hypothetical protein